MNVIKVKSIIGVFLIIPLLFLGCSNKCVTKKMRFKEVLASFEVNFTNIPSNNLKAFSDFYKVTKFNNRVLLYFLDWNAKKIILWDILSNKLFKSIKLENIENIVFNNRIDINFYKFDRIAVFSDNDQILSIIDTNGKLINQIKTSGTYQEHQYVSVAYGHLSMQYLETENCFLTQIAHIDIILNDKKRFQEYFNRPMFLKIDLDSFSTKFFDYKLPTCYLQGNYYGSTSFFKGIDYNQNYVFSYPSEDSLYIYNPQNKTTEASYCGFSSFSRMTNYDLDKLLDYSYLRKYHIEQSKFNRLIYNNFDSSMYRVFELGKDYIDQNGSVTDFTSIPWGLIKINEKLDLLEEYYFDDSIYSNKAVLPLNNNFLVSKKRTSVKDSVLRFDLIKL